MFMLTENLPITRDTKKLRNLVIGLVANFAKRFKYTIGERMTNIVLDLNKYIRRANEDTDPARRYRYIQEIRFLLGDLNDLIDCSIEHRVISVRQLSQLAELSTSIGKQASGWLKSIR